MRKVFLQLILIVTFFALNINLFAADYYWRKVPLNNNYHEISNWSTDPSGEGSYPGSAPSSGDNVYFNNPSTIRNIVASTKVTMRNLVCSVDSSEKITISTAPSVEISGNVNINGNFEISSSIVVIFTAFTTHTGAELNTGGIPVTLGRSMSIEMPGESFDLRSDLILVNTTVTRLNTDFNSNGYSITVPTFDIGTTPSSSPSYRIINLLGSTITVNGNNNPYLQLVCDSYTTLNTSTTDIVLEAGNLRFYTYRDNPYIVNSITFSNESGGLSMYTSYNSSGINWTNVIVNELIFDTPNFTLPTNNHYFNEITVNNLVIKRKTSILFGATNNQGIYTVLKVGSIDVQPTGCLEQSSFVAGLGVSFENTGNSTMVFDNLSISGVYFTGNFGWQSNKKNDGGGNSGAITWVSNINKNYYWRGGTGNWADPDHWYVDAITPDGCIPTSVDDVYFDSNSFQSASDIISIDNGVCRNIYWTGANGMGSLVPSNKTTSLLSISGDADFSGVSVKGIKTNLFFGGLSGNTITSLPNDITYTSEFIYIKGNYTLLNNLIAGRTETGYAPTTLYHIAGTFNSNGNNIYIQEHLNPNLLHLMI